MGITCTCIAHNIANLTLKLNFEKLKPEIFLNFHFNTDCISESLCKSFEGGPSYDKQCNSPSQIHSSVYFRLIIV